MPRKTAAGGLFQQRARQASMRPRPDAAENAAQDTRRRVGIGCFNEAAARCRGKRRDRRPQAPDARRASMRPRPDAAENTRATNSYGMAGWLQ